MSSSNQEENKESYPVYCSVTGAGMNEGWYINGEYYSTQELADKAAQDIPNEEVEEDVNYKDFEELYESLSDDQMDFAYWTTFEEEEEN